MKVEINVGDWGLGLGIEFWVWRLGIEIGDWDWGLGLKIRIED